MNNGTKSLSINETFIIEPVDGVEVYSACTAFYTNNLISCSGNTEIIMGIGGVSTNLAFSAVTFYGDGSNLTGISTHDTYITGGTYNPSTGTATFTNNTGGKFSVSGFSTGSSFTGGTVSGETIFTGGLSADTFSATTYYNLPSSTFTGGTVSGATIFTNGLTTNTISATTYINLPSLLGNYLPLSGGTVTGNTTFTQNLFTNTISATTYQNLPTDIRVTGSTYSNNTFTYTNNTGGTFNVLFNTVSGLTVNGNLSVTGNTSLRSFTGTSGTISGSGQNILTVIGSGNSTTSPLFTIQGSQGELFSVTDSLTGSLFSVNDISGLPILEAFSDNTVLMGSYLAPSLNTTVRTTANSGTTNIYSIPVSAYTGGFYEYTIDDGSNARAGNIMAIFSGTSVQFTESSTLCIGTTTGVTFSVVISSGNAILRTSATTNNWIVKTIIRSI